MSGAGRDAWLRLTAFLAIALPLLVLHRAFLRPATHLVAARPDAYSLDDPTTNATAMARAWARLDHGDFVPHDDRVFAPAPNAIALGEYYPLPSLVGYPFARLFDSVPLGVNVPYYLALALFPVAAYAFYAEVAGPGPGAALAALLVAWGPARMNSLGVLSLLTSGLVVLAAAFAVRFLTGGRGRDLAGFAALLLAQAFSGLYPLAQGGLFGLAAVPLAAGKESMRPRRLAALAGAGAAALAPAALWHAPLFRLGEDFGIEPGPSTFEAHAADLLSLLHGGIFGGPVRDLLERAVPGFPLGAAAFFPTLSVLAALVTWAVWRRSSRDAAERSPLPWVLLAAALFVLALGPTVRAAGRPIGPGPAAALSKLPVLSSMRGIHRYDQWFDVALGAAAALAFASLERRTRSRRLAAIAAAVVLLDVWPADVPAFRFPEPSPAARSLAALGPDAIVAYYPMGRPQATRAWVDQIAHGRRVVNGWFTFDPLPHAWLNRAQRTVDGPVGLAMLRDFGAEVVVVDPGLLDPPRRESILRLRAPDAALRLRSISSAGRLLLFRFEPRVPAVFTAADLTRLRFQGARAPLGGTPGTLALFFGPASIPAEVTSPAGAVPALLNVPPVQAGPLQVFADGALPPGGEVRRLHDGVLLGTVDAVGP